MKNEILKLIPKSKLILSACAILEIKNETLFVEEFLRDNVENLSDDLMAIYLALLNRNNKKIPVLNYGGLATKLDVLYRDDLHVKKKLIMGKQLQKRKLRDINSSKMDSAKLLLFPIDYNLLGNYYTKLAYKVRRNWDDGNTSSIFRMMNQPDENILRMMKYFFDGTRYKVDNSEIAVFDAIINEKHLDNLIREYTSWKNHETDRSKTIHQTLKQYHIGKKITTTDPRIIICIVLKGKLEHRKVIVKYTHLVSKIFPRFWEVIDYE